MFSLNRITTLFFLLVYLLLNAACNTHYGYRSKVRVTTQNNPNAPAKHSVSNTKTPTNFLKTKNLIFLITRIKNM